MAIAFVKPHNGGSSTTSGTTLTFTLTSPVPAGNLLAVYVGHDNTTTSAPSVSSITRQSGETTFWASVTSHNSSTATSGGGVRGAWWVIVPTVTWAAATYTITLTAAVVSKVCIVAEFSGATVTTRAPGVGGTSTSGTPSATTGAPQPVAGDLVLGGATFESNVAPSGDTDTVGGSWDGLTSVANTGTALTSVAVAAYFKIVTAGGMQTFNPTGANDSGSCVVALTPAATRTGRPKVWTGSAWVNKPAKVWTGSAWVEKPVKAWNGSSWQVAK